MKYFIIIVCLLFFSCKDKKKTSENNSVKIEKVRKDISIADLIYHSAFDGIKNEGDYELYQGVYKLDRFNSNKKSLFLDGISDYGIIENNKNINPKNQMTISIWYKPDAYKGNGYNVILSKPNTEDKPQTNQYVISSIGNLYPNVPGTFKFFLTIDGKQHHVKTKPNTWLPNNWYLITATYDGSRMNLYVNGVLLAGRKVSGKIDIYNSNLFIGKTPYKEFYTSGSYDDLKIYDRALTQDEITAIYKNK